MSILTGGVALRRDFGSGDDQGAGGGSDEGRMEALKKAALMKSLARPAVKGKSAALKKSTIDCSRIL